MFQKLVPYWLGLGAVAISVLELASCKETELNTPTNLVYDRVEKVNDVDTRIYTRALNNKLVTTSSIVQCNDDFEELFLNEFTLYKDYDFEKNSLLVLSMEEVDYTNAFGPKVTSLQDGHLELTFNKGSKSNFITFVELYDYKVINYDINVIEDKLVTKEV